MNTINKTFCINCEDEMILSDSGYCNQCGGHYDNITPASYRDDFPLVRIYKKGKLI